MPVWRTENERKKKAGLRLVPYRPSFVASRKAGITLIFLLNRAFERKPKKFMQINYCLLPNENQIRFAEYLGKRYGEIVKFNYFAIVTNPYPQKIYAVPKIQKNTRRKSSMSAPKLFAYYSPLLGRHINEAIPCSTKVLPTSRLPKTA